MKLLLITQTVDMEDANMGFFHNWILEFSKKFEKISVICLEKGSFDLPKNVKVFSLGKESGRNRIKYLKNFFSLIFGLRKEYDSVFVHMNQEYVLLGGFMWKIMGKKVFMWRNHLKGNLLTRIAVALSDKVFCTSTKSFTAKFKKTEIMPVGIDTSIFNTKLRTENYESYKNKILFLSRISPVKKVDLLVETLGILKNKKTDFTADIYGDPLPKDEDYYLSIKNRAKELKLDKQINFYKGVANYETPKIYSQYNIFVNLTPSGSFDKTILEAAACGCIPIVINKSLGKDFPIELVSGESAEEIASKIIFCLNLPENERNMYSEKLQKYVLENHSLSALVNKVVVLLSSPISNKYQK